MTELFLLVGTLAVISAVFMLLSDNAVHSALFLVGTMVAIAIMFLLLNAPFLALIQITVYAGAIMVLFLFVIMLLGAERTDISALIGSDKRKFRWYIPVAAVVVGILFLVVAIGVFNSGIAGRDIPAADPQARVMHVAQDVGTVDVFAGETLIAEDLMFGEASDFVTLPAGESTLLFTTDTGEQFSAVVALEAASASAIVAHGAGTPTLSVVPIDLSTVNEQRSGRTVVFNAYDGVDAIQLIDIGTPADENDDNVLIESVAAGAFSEALTLEEEERVNWFFVDAAETNDVLTRLEDYEVMRDESTLVVITQAPVGDGTMRVAPFVTSAESRPAFGSPRAIGYELFITYMLPMQLLALLLLAAMVGAIVLTRREWDKVRDKVGVRRRVSRPLAEVIAAQVGDQEGVDAPQLPGGEGSTAAGD